MPIINIHFISSLQTRSVRSPTGTASSGNRLPGVLSVSGSTRTSAGRSSELLDEGGDDDEFQREGTSPPKKMRRYSDGDELLQL